MQTLIIASKFALEATIFILLGNIAAASALVLGFGLANAL